MHSDIQNVTPLYLFGSFIMSLLVASKIHDHVIFELGNTAVWCLKCR